MNFGFFCGYGYCYSVIGGICERLFYVEGLLGFLRFVFWLLMDIEDFCSFEVYVWMGLEIVGGVKIGKCRYMVYVGLMEVDVGGLGSV